MGAHNAAVGRYGERLAARRLGEQGMVVIDRNWSGRSGEVDLVLRDGPALVFCEVKTRTSLGCGVPHEAVTPRKVARMRRVAAEWLEHHDVHADEVRLDLVAVFQPRRGAALVDHVRGIG